MNYLEYSLDRLDELPPTRGLYTWHIKLIEGVTLEQYYSLLRHKVFSTNVKGVFNENYEGKLTLTKRVDTSNIDPPTKYIIEELSKLINSPIYIGISDNLNRRLNQHYKDLTSFVYTGKKNSEILDWDDKYEDTEEESTYFGGRIGTILNENNIKAINILFVRIYELNVDRKNLLSIEKFFNQCILPIYGKR
jgi:hypothetical protein